MGSRAADPDIEQETAGEEQESARAEQDTCWWISWWVGQVLGWFIPCPRKEGHKNKLFFTPAKRNPLWNAKSSVSGRTFSSFLVPVLGPKKGTSDDAEIGHPLSKSYKEVPI